jgi:hypothetical protein
MEDGGSLVSSSSELHNIKIFYEEAFITTIFTNLFSRYESRLNVI